ncbi:U3 small nucleolar RNA-associated protein 25 homolog isoform X2 [Coccinella septempunctata]|uniref:U3 small nucleolar RNA-associated protein 25 homolog isoform X2 n=1 Tax=Coccinella septempunctata TaxID=41139 RepID=UPI001D064AE5|nr:U3 small nucleolar RNA-associated protein 25 homolog isoform X2 [Coccinella septempunctata]
MGGLKRKREDKIKKSVDKTSNKKSLDVDMEVAESQDESMSHEDEVESEQESSNQSLEEDEDEELEGTDPFTKHFKNSLHPTLLKSLESPSGCMPQEKENWPILRNVVISIPSCSEAESDKESKKLLDDEVEYTLGGIPPKILNLKELTPRSLHIKTQIAKNLKTANCALNESIDESKFLTEFQNELFSIMNNYQDLCFTKQTLNNIDSMRFVYCLHMVNHILKTRMKVLRHNTKLKNRGDDDVPDEYRDQGFVRPKVLVLLPFKSSAYKVISVLEKLLFPEGKKGSVMNKKRFLEEYQEDTQRIPIRKPEEYKMIFSGNTHDDFTMGISITRKALKLYSEFYSSDIIIASPMSLRRIIGAKGDKERDYDFLSSIELLILDQADIFMMQNWHHVLHIFDHLHLKLRDYKRPDYARVRLWSLDGHAKFFRQTLIFSTVNAPLIASLITTRCHNFAGKVIVNKQFPNGSICDVRGELQHDFYKFTVEKATDIPQKRFEFFMHNVFPLFQEQSMRQVLIYIPSYYDFVRLRNHFMRESINFNQICETSPKSKVAEARDLFCNEDVHFLLYTERYHFYNRIILKGIRHIVFYDLPNYPHYYSEMCNMMNNENLLKSKRCLSNFTVSAIYTQADYLKLIPIVGSKKAKSMFASERNLHRIMI